MDQLNELGFYVLAGAPQSPAELIDEVSGGRGARPRLHVHLRALQHQRRRSRSRVRSARCRRRSASRPRPPTTTRATRSSPRRTPRPCTASPAGRFTLGLGRGIAPLFDAYGIPRITTAQIEDFVGLMRRLWKGEVVFGHDGPAGKFPVLHLDASFDEDIPLGFVAFGPELARARRPLLRRRRAPHVLHRRDRRTLRRDRPARGRGRGPRSRVGAHLVVLRDHRRPSARRAPAQEDGRAPGHVPPGLRRSPRRDQRLGSGGAGALPRRRGRVVVPGRARHQGRHRGARTRRHAAARRVARAGGDRRRATARRACSASSISASTASSCTARRRPSSRPIVEAYRAIRPAGRFDGWPANPGARGSDRPPNESQADGRDHRRRRRRHRDGHQAPARATTSRSTRSPTAWAARGATTPIPAPRATCRRTCTRSRSS